MQEGFDEGVAAAGGRIVVRQLLTAMRHQARSMEIAELAVAWRDRGVAGFDIAGAEAGYPPTRHLDAFEYLQRENAHFTIHAGEAFGLPSIWQAIQWCGADRLGHGVRIIDDITVHDDGSVELGRLAAYVRDTRHPARDVPARPTSRPGPPTSIAEHPIGLLTRLRFRVTVNTDNRLMSQTSMTDEMFAPGRGVRLRPRRPALVHHQRDEVGVPALRRAARDHRPGHQAGVRRPHRLTGERVTTAPRHPPAAEPSSRRRRATPRG